MLKFSTSMNQKENISFKCKPELFTLLKIDFVQIPAELLNDMK